MKRSLWTSCFIVLCLGAGAAHADLGAELAYYVQGTTVPGSSPSYDWWYGCSPTSAGMMMGYYDRSGYGGLAYSNLVPGGVAETSSFGTPSPLVNNVIASAGHIADFYAGGYEASGDDGLGPYHRFNSLADFMGTSQDSAGNVNGGTTFYYNDRGYRVYYSDLIAAGDQVWGSDGMYGIREYVQYAGYDVASLYTQATRGAGRPFGFTFDDYMAEIDAGRVVMIHVEGHSMFGYGYDEGSSQILLHDTWDGLEHYMTWGGAYSGMNLWGVTVMELTGGQVVPIPAAILLGMLGLGTAGMKLRKFV